jgi:hypothetical protein
MRLAETVDLKSDSDMIETYGKHTAYGCGRFAARASEPGALVKAAIGFLGS